MPTTSPSAARRAPSARRDPPPRRSRRGRSDPPARGGLECPSNDRAAPASFVGAHIETTRREARFASARVRRAAISSSTPPPAEPDTSRRLRRPRPSFGREVAALRRVHGVERGVKFRTAANASTAPTGASRRRVAPRRCFQYTNQDRPPRRRIEQVPQCCIMIFRVQVTDDDQTSPVASQRRGAFVDDERRLDRANVRRPAREK